ncbi:MAG: hypothetical protein ACRD1H_07655 [Vicinamibacterales bacterium]
MKGLDALMEHGVALALALGLGAACPLDIRTCATVVAVEEQDARPEIDRLFVLVGKVKVETGEQQMLNPGVALGAAQRLSRRV